MRVIVRGRKLHTRKVNRHEAIPSAEGDGIRYNGTRDSVAWAKSGAGHRHFGFLRLHAYMEFQVIDVMVEFFRSTLREELSMPRCRGGEV
jgi:hypothetical protein